MATARQNVVFKVKLLVDLASDVSVQYLLELEVIETLDLTEKKERLSF